MIMLPTGDEINQAKDEMRAAIAARPATMTLTDIATAAGLPEYAIKPLMSIDNKVSVWRLRQIQDALIDMGLVGQNDTQSE